MQSVLQLLRALPPVRRVGSSGVRTPQKDTLRRSAETGKEPFRWRFSPSASHINKAEIFWILLFIFDFVSLSLFPFPSATHMFTRMCTRVYIHQGYPLTHYILHCLFFTPSLSFSSLLSLFLPLSSSRSPSSSHRFYCRDICLWYVEERTRFYRETAICWRRGFT